jgi:hypothetical protein
MVKPLSRGKLIAIVTGIVFIGLTSLAFCQLPPTNEQVLVEAVAKSFSLPSSLPVNVSKFQLKSAHGLDELAVDGLRDYFTNTKPEALSYAGGNVDSSSIINVSVSALQLTYGKGKSRGFLRKPYIRRTIAGQILVSISGNGVNYSGFQNIKYSDEIEYNQANYVASLRYKELAPQQPSPGAPKYLEPLAVGATVGGLIYLFFINR